MSAPRILFCMDPRDPRSPELAFAHEARAARAAGLEIGLVDWEALVEEDLPRRATLRAGSPGAAIYRGWMLRPARYAALYTALAARGVTLETTPAAYERAHCFPGWYPLIRAHTPESLRFPTPVDVDAALGALAAQGERAWIVKDDVKSRKHEWAEACYVPSGAERAAAERVIRAFLERQGDDLVGGLVLRGSMGRWRGGEAGGGAIEGSSWLAMSAIGRWMIAGGA